MKKAVCFNGLFLLFIRFYKPIVTSTMSIHFTIRIVHVCIPTLRTHAVPYSTSHHHPKKNDSPKADDPFFPFFCHVSNSPYVLVEKQKFNQHNHRHKLQQSSSNQAKRKNILARIKLLLIQKDFFNFKCNHRHTPFSF